MQIVPDVPNSDIDKMSLNCLSMTQSKASDRQNEGVAMLEMWKSDLERLDQINNGKDVAKSRGTQVVTEKYKSMIGNVQIAQKCNKHSYIEQVSISGQINNRTVEAKSGELHFCYRFLLEVYKISWELE